MKSNEIQIMRIFLRSDVKHKAGTLYESLVFEAKRSGMQYAIVHKGSSGFNNDGNISNDRSWRIPQRLPVVIEIIDLSEKIDKFREIIQPLFEGIKKECMITISQGEGIFFEASKKHT